MGRILYLSTVFSRPAGGVRMIFHHVRELRNLGFDAYVVCTGGAEAPTWFEPDAPILIDSPLNVNATDILVMPEVGPGISSVAMTAPCRKVLFCQNHFAVFIGMKDIGDWNRIGIQDVMYCSQVTADMVNRCFSFRNSSVIRCGIDHHLFRPGETKTPSIVVMPRKRVDDVQLIREIFARQWPHYKKYPWYALNNCTAQSTAEAMARSAVFLSLSYREGLGLPPLEAMASDCLVAGFTGHGGKDYATRDNGLWVEEDDIYGAADALGRALQMVLERPEETAALRAAGRATAASYSFEAMRRDLKAFWERVLAS